LSKFYSDETAILKVNNSARQSTDKVPGNLGGNNKLPKNLLVSKWKLAKTHSICSLYE